MRFSPPRILRVPLPLPIASQHYAPNRYRRRSGRTAPRRPYGAVAAAFALIALAVAAGLVLDGQLHGATGGRLHPPALTLPGAGVPANGSQLGVPGLAGGACWALPPTAGDLGRTVFVDAGHGGPDPGAVGAGVTEKQATLAVALGLASMLRGAGWRVVLSRTSDSSVAKLGGSDLDSGALTGSGLHRDLVERVLCANAAHAEALLSIHFNGYDDPTVGGTQTFYDSDRTFSARSLRLAQSLQTALVRELGRDDRGVTSDGQLAAATITDEGAAYGHLVEFGPAAPGWVDAPSTMPGALVEPLFVSNPDEAALAGSGAGQQRIARALFNGFQAYAGA